MTTFLDTAKENKFPF